MMEELVKFTLLTRGRKEYLTSRYSDRREEAVEFAARPKLQAI